jgi:hypothetical protein
MKTMNPFFPLASSSSNQLNEKTHLELPARKNIFWRLFKHPYLMPYNRLAICMFLINVLLFLKLQNAGSEMELTRYVLFNFAVALLIRQQYVVNGLFALATRIPTNWPLSIRWAAGKIYHFGGVHVGCFFSGTIWLGLSILNLAKTKGLSSLTILSVVHFVLLCTMILVALPPIRSRFHNLFERVARFGSWTSLVLFWIQSLTLNADRNDGSFSASIEFWILSLLTFSTLLPWLRLRQVPVKWLRPSSHVALAEFDYGVTPFAGSSTELSRSPFFEWHSFANVPSPHKPGYRLTISRAGDWTGRLIDDLPEKIWVKGIPTAGVGNIETLFKRVIWVATGSGIGPCLPHLLSAKVPSRLVWSTRNPNRTYSPEFVNEILEVQPDAVIWDTDQNGKPDLVKLAYQAYRDFDAEAIICISNKNVTWHVVEEFESRGIPAFGAIWDS